MFLAKGGVSANKTFLYQETKALLNPDSLEKFLDEKIRTLGTAACPPYHLAIVIGGTSAELNLKTVKLASARYLDALPTKGTNFGQAMRDIEWEKRILLMTQKMDLGKVLLVIVVKQIMVWQQQLTSIDFMEGGPPNKAKLILHVRGALLDA